jgi:hypothetical protein
MNRQFQLVVMLLLATCPVSRLAMAQQDRPWAFSGPQAVEPPVVEHADRVVNPIDAFVLARLEEKGLDLAPAASRRTLIRRLFIDLVGLPPTPGEVRAFIEDEDPAAYEKLVDRLLEDTRYGERWARFWLDLARYADTAGYEGDPDLPHAWRYRDYVIDSLNKDKPYDLFIKEQIAGDEFADILGAGDLPGVEAEKVVAMTFLRLAPFTEPRGDASRHEVLSEMTATVGSVFLGMTVGCAKCHDHKYDEIPTRDFYRMKAFFATVQIPRPEPGDGFQIGGSLDAGFYREGEKEWAAKKRSELEAQVAEARTELEELKEQLEQRLEGQSGFGLQAMGSPFGNNHTFERRKVNDGELHWTIVNSDARRWQFLTDGAEAGRTGSLAEADEGDWFADLASPKHVSLGQYNEGSGTPKQYGHRGHFGEILLYDHPLDKQEREAVAAYVQQKYQPDDDNQGKDGPAAPPQEGLRFWIDAADMDADATTPNPEPGAKVDAWVDRVGGLRLSQADVDLQPTMDTLGKNKAPAVRFDGDFLIGMVEGAAFLDDQKGALVAVYTASHKGEGYAFEVGGEGSFISTFIYSGGKGGVLDAVLSDSGDPAITLEERRRYRYLASREKFLPQHLKRLQPVAMSLRHSYGPPYEPGVPTSRVMIRGEWDNPGEVVQPGFPSAITGNQDPAPIRLDPFKRWPMRSRRMALAQWIASPENPLTARVMVNRLWHWHFGQGIVVTPSDFGMLGGGPSHPELLDWLALEFIRQGWKVKAMHRLICLSATYRQRSDLDHALASEIDPGNRLLWHFNRRRLQGEAIRDSVLAVSGRLNPQHHGLPIFPPLPGDIADRVKYTDSKWDTQHGPEGRKRSIYIYQQRTLMMPLLQTFDAIVCDESRPRRATSVTPLQALAMYNGEFVNQEAGHFAGRVVREAGPELVDQVQRAFELALARPATDDELRKLTEYVESREDRASGLHGLCRILYNTSEFIYID